MVFSYRAEAMILYLKRSKTWPKSECERLAWALLLESNLLVGNRRSNGDDDDDDVDVAPAA